MIDFLNYYRTKGHVFGECMTSSKSDFMYVNIPKNASSWTKPNLLDLGWSNYNYHTDNLYNKTAIVVLRDPLERWISGMAEYLNRIHPSFEEHMLNQSFIELIVDRVAFDDHTEKQVLFLQNLNKDNCVFLKCNQSYSESFSAFLNSIGFPNRYYKYNWQNVSSDQERLSIKTIFQKLINNNSDYQKKVEWYFEEDYNLINSVKFYDPR